MVYSVPDYTVSSLYCKSRYYQEGYIFKGDNTIIGLIKNLVTSDTDKS